MAFTRAGFDVFNAEVDDKGIDFVLRVDGDVPRYYDVQVKTVRSRNTYVFVRKDKFRLTPNLLLALVILDAGNEPDDPGRRLAGRQAALLRPQLRRAEVGSRVRAHAVVVRHGRARTIPIFRNNPGWSQWPIITYRNSGTPYHRAARVCGKAEIGGLS
jgi:hypothetical protein